MKATWKPGVSMRHVEIQIIKIALTHHRGDKKKVAKDLRISVRKIRDLCRDVPELQVFYRVPHSQRRKYN